MPRTARPVCIVIVVSAALATTAALSQSTYDDALLAVKRRFARSEIAALAEPFTGVATSSGLVPGLFPIRASGVSTEPIRQAASSFLTTLTPEQQIRTVFAVDAPEWRRWSNVDNGIYVRQGVSLEEMTEDQHDAALDLLRVSLSARGLRLSQDIMKTDQTLRELNHDILRYGEEKYFFTVMGIPSREEAWGWQLDGHHLVINYFVLGDQVVMTPVFLGGEPVVTESGKYEGNAILQEEQDQGLALLNSLSDDQRTAAILQPDKTVNNIVAEANQDNRIVDYEGVSASVLSTAQQRQLLELVDACFANTWKRTRTDASLIESLHACTRVAPVAQCT